MNKVRSSRELQGGEPPDPVEEGVLRDRQMVREGRTLRAAVEMATSGTWLRATVFERNPSFYWDWLSRVVAGWRKQRAIRLPIWGRVLEDRNALLAACAAL